MFPQVDDFLEESRALAALLKPLADADYAQPTQFKQWTLNDILGHLHVWNVAADQALHQPEAFAAFFANVKAAMAGGDLRTFERDSLKGLSGMALRETWQAFFEGMAKRFAGADPKARVRWAGPDMSVRASITARQMETWAHGQAIYDVLGVDRVNGERLRNIAHLGVQTFGWTFANRRLEVPEPAPYVLLESPAGHTWEWNTPRDDERVEGDAVAFCQVVTQVRNVADTSLRVTGETAGRWMLIAQCFAGPPVDPPAPGTRFKQQP